VNWELTFWLAIAFALYVYLGFPLLLVLMRKVMEAPVRREPILPSLSVMIPAYNEAAVIADKIRNTLEADYPPDKIEIVIASDGSSDGTAQVAREMLESLNASGRVRLLDFKQNRGKLRVLNEVVPQMSGAIVVFSDAATMIDRQALRYLVTAFADPRVGAVSSVYGIVQPDGSSIGQQEEVYWKYETFLKRQEAALDSILGCHGALYAIRKHLYPAPSPKVINDDYVIPMRIVQKGYRVVYEPRAIASEAAAESTGFSRRIRIQAGNFAQLFEMAGLLWPRRLLPLFFFLSHKAARLMVPLAMLVALVANFFLLDEPLYMVTLAAQVALYGLALAGPVLPLRPALLRLPYYFCMINAAIFPGFYYAVTRGGRMSWNRKREA
jgi:cellulose synthase/poly-beta-1,6-N-acetylglucosamine synthase-like glycosyltransferase